MYVEKFEADSMDEALKSVKNKLGPDAIILKTKTNKGLKGAFAKNKIEITAAISEKNYVRKAKVDNVLNDGQKEAFYQGPSDHISEMIDDYSGNKEEAPSLAGYGKMALNKVVKKTNEVKSGLDDFLAQSAKPQAPQQVAIQNLTTPKETTERLERAPVQQRVDYAEANYDKEIDQQQKKIDLLEQKIYELTKSLEKVERKESVGLLQLRTTLKSLNIEEAIIQRIIKKAAFELKESDLENEDLVFELALREMANSIKTELPLFSNVDEEPVVTILLSESTSGQTSTAYKLCSLKENSVLIELGEKESSHELSSKVFNIDVKSVNNVSEVITQIRKAVEQERSCFVDFKSLQIDKEETKKFIQGARRAFKNVEVLTCLSSINSEIYNRKCLNKFEEVSNGLIFTQLDLCMDYGSMFNIHLDSSLPLKFFTTGRVIPDDIEAATKERILNGLFKFN